MTTTVRWERKQYELYGKNEAGTSSCKNKQNKWFVNSLNCTYHMMSSKPYKDWYTPSRNSNVPRLFDIHWRREKVSAWSGEWKYVPRRVYAHHRRWSRFAFRWIPRCRVWGGHIGDRQGNNDSRRLHATCRICAGLNLPKRRDWRRNCKRQTGCLLCVSIHQVLNRHPTHFRTHHYTSSWTNPLDNPLK